MDVMEAYASPRGEHPKRTRTAQNSSEDSDDVPLRLEPFRVGGPYLPKLGSRFEVVSPISPWGRLWDDTLKNEVEKVLQRHGITFDVLSFVSYTSDPPVSSELFAPELTVLIIATARGSGREWLPAAESLVKAVRQHGEGYVINVELLDNRAREKTLTYPIKPTEPVVDSWPTVKEEILQAISGKDWTILSLLRRGKPSGPKELVATLSISPNSTENWLVVRDEMVSILDRAHLNDVAVQIVRGTIIRAAGGDDRMLLDVDSFDLEISMGRSIGPKGSEKHPSTFGGFMLLSWDNGATWTKYGLTCFHSVAPVDCGHSSLSRWQQQGIFPHDPTNNLEMDSPSIGDAQETVRSWQKAIGDVKARVQDIEQRLADPDDFVTDKERLRHQKANQTVAAYTAKVDACNSFCNGNETLGKVYAASGFRLSAANIQKALDWALIDVVAARLSSNKLPESDKIPHKHRGSYNPLDDAIPGVANVSTGMDLFKIGRTTGFTAGRLSGVKTSTLQSWVPTPDGTMKSVVSDTYAITPLAVMSNDFGQGGDSGSFVLDSEGKFVGLYFGESEFEGFFTAANELIEDIKTFTGATDVTPCC